MRPASAISCGLWLNPGGHSSNVANLINIFIIVSLFWVNLILRFWKTALWDVISFHLQYLLARDANCGCLGPVWINTPDEKPGWASSCWTEGILKGLSNSTAGTSWVVDDGIGVDTTGFLCSLIALPSSSWSTSTPESGVGGVAWRRSLQVVLVSGLHFEMFTGQCYIKSLIYCCWFE